MQSGSSDSEDIFRRNCTIGNLNVNTQSSMHTKHFIPVVVWLGVCVPPIQHTHTHTQT